MNRKVLFLRSEIWAWNTLTVEWSPCATISVPCAPDMAACLGFLWPHWLLVRPTTSRQMCCDDALPVRFPPFPLLISLKLHSWALSSRVEENHVFCTVTPDVRNGWFCSMLFSPFCLNSIWLYINKASVLVSVSCQSDTPGKGNLHWELPPSG